MMNEKILVKIQLLDSEVDFLKVICMSKMDCNYLKDSPV